MKTYWLIEGHDGTEIIYSEKILAGRLPIHKMELLLQILAAKHGLVEREIIGALQKRKTKGKNDFLEVTTSNNEEKRTTVYSCGETPRFTARAIRE